MATDARHDDIHLFVFFSDGQSLAGLDDTGMLDRELAFLGSLASRVGALTLVTYGTRRDTAIAADHAPLGLIHNRWRLPRRLYRAWLGPVLRRRTTGRPVYMSRQISGAPLALSLARTNQAAYIARCGYMLSDFRGRRHGLGSPKHRAALEIERRVFDGAAVSMVTTEAMRDHVVGLGVPADRVVVVPNHVDTDLFRPGDPALAGDDGGPIRLRFVGRLVAQKNPLALIEALRGLPVVLEVAGDGPLRSAMADAATAAGVALTLHGVIGFRHLPAFLAGGQIFVMPSLYEGHPKALLEAMACGLAIVATDVDGVRTVVADDRTGLLCAPTPEGLRAAVVRLIADPDLRRRLGAAARTQILETVPMARAVDQTAAACRRAASPP